MPSQEQGVPLQTDQLSTVPGGSIRTVTVVVPNAFGVPTPVQMQVVCAADANGVIFQAPEITLPILLANLSVLKDIRVMLSKLTDTPFVDNQIIPGLVAGTST